MEKRIKNKHEIGMKSRNGSLYYEGVSKLPFYRITLATTTCGGGGMRVSTHPHQT